MSLLCFKPILDKNVIIYLRFQEVDSPVGFLKVCTVEKDGMEVSKKSIGIPKNSLIHKWSQLGKLVEVIYQYEPTNEDIWKKHQTPFIIMNNLLDSPAFNFLVEQFQLLITNKYGQRYSKQSPSP